MQNSKADCYCTSSTSFFLLALRSLSHPVGVTKFSPNHTRHLLGYCNAQLVLDAKQEILRHIWETLDGNRDNVVSQKELEIPHDQLELSPPCRLDELLRNEDLDEDGQLDFRELLTAYGTSSSLITLFSKGDKT